MDDTLAIAYLEKHGIETKLTDIDHRFTVITPNSGTSKQILRVWHASKAHQNTLAPEALTLTQWIVNTYSQSTSRQCSILPFWQQQLLWRKCILLLQPNLDAQEANFLAKQYHRIYQNDHLTTVTQDTNYLSCLSLYHNNCLDYNLIDSIALLRAHQSWLNRQESKLLFHGFGILSTSVKLLWQSIDPIYYLASFATVDTSYRKYPHTSSQYEAVSLSIRSVQARDPNAEHLIICHEPQALDRLSHTLKQVCYPEDSVQLLSTSSAIKRMQPSYLTSEIFIQSCIDFLTSLAQKNLPSLITSTSHPLFAIEGVSKTFYQSLQSLPAFTDLGAWTNYGNQYFSDQPCWLLYKKFVHYLFAVPIPSSLTWHQWADWIQQHLQDIIIELTPAELRHYAQLQRALYQCTPLDKLMAPSTSLHGYLNHLHDYLAVTAVEPCNKNSSIVLGTWQDSLAYPCDYLWVIDAHSQVWPANLTTFNQDSISRESWLRLHRYQSDYARHVTICYAMTDAQEQQLQPTHLVSEPWLDDHDPYTHPHYVTQALVPMLDKPFGPALKAEESSVGSGVLKNYSQCACKGFIEHRLHHKPTPDNIYGYNAQEIGTLTHQCLAHWFDLNKIVSQEAMQSWLHTVLKDYDWPNPKTPAQKDTIASYISKLCHSWLLESVEMHKHEDAFTFRHEVAIQYKLGPLTMRLRADRIDYLSDQTLRVVDYKTGKTQRQGWQGPRLDEPQLPLYAIGIKPTSAITFVSLHPDQWGYQGIADSPSALPGIKSYAQWKPKDLDMQWQEQLVTWRVQLEALAEQYHRGYAAANPKSPQSCQFCQLQPICRKYENLMVTDCVED